MGESLPVLRRSCDALAPLERSADFVWQKAGCSTSWVDVCVGVGLSPAMSRERLGPVAVADAVAPYMQYGRVAICEQHR